ncbi:MarR family transcriptional regulator [Mucilaginibacter koreensis]
MLADTKTDLGIELGKAITEFRNKLRQFIHQKFKEHQINLSFEMLEVLGYLWKKNGMNQQEIADLTLKDKSSITYLIDNLVKRNLVTRVEDDNDRRNKLIFLTPEAQQLREQLHPWVNEMYSVASNEISVDEMQSILKLISKMTANLS